MTDSDTLEIALDSLLKQAQDKSWKKPVPEELSQLICAFLPSQTPELRSKAYLVLSTVCQHIRESAPPQKGEETDSGTDTLFKLFAASVASRLGENRKSDDLVALSFLTALFQVDWQSGAVIFSTTAVESVEDLIELSPSPEISLEISHLLSQASAHKLCRERLSSLPSCLRWLEKNARQTDDIALQSSSAIALIKLWKGYAADTRDIPGSESKTPSPSNEGDLVALMTKLVVDNGPSSSITDAIEGLAYMSVDPTVKDTLSKDSTFLAKLFGQFSALKRFPVAPSTATTANNSQIYGAAVIISNICSYRPRQSQEQAQIAKLRSMAKVQSSGKLGETKENPLEDDSYVKERCRRLLRAGVVDVLTTLVRVADSPGVLMQVGKGLLSLTEDKENRGKILQSGGSRALVIIIRSMLAASPSPKTQVDESILDPIQALAKLAITSSPVQVFGPDQGAVLDAIRPLSLLLVHPSATLLQQFESLMALTNISSSSPAAATRVAEAEGLLNKTEFLLLEDHTLIRRAAMELICNLITGSDDVFDKYGGQGASGSKSKLQVLVALSDVDDGATRIAASGALATVTASPHACRVLFELQMDRHRVLPIFTQLVNPTASEESDEPEDATTNAGLLHRGLVCVRNLLASLDEPSLRSLIPDAQSSGLVAGLVRVVKSNVTSQNMTILQPAAESLKRLLDGGASVGAQ